MEGATEVWVLATTLVVGGVLVAGVGLKQRRGTLKRNWVAGLRTTETLRSDAAWRAAHDATAAPVVAGGLVLVAAGALVPFARGREALTAALVLGAAAVTLVLVGAAGVRGHRIARRVNLEADGQQEGQPGPGGHGT